MALHGRWSIRQEPDSILGELYSNQDHHRKQNKRTWSWALEDNLRELEKETNLNNNDHSYTLGKGYKPLKSPCDADKKMQWIGPLGQGVQKALYLMCRRVQVFVNAQL
jgi:hypothetical protein